MRKEIVTKYTLISITVVLLLLRIFILLDKIPIIEADTIGYIEHIYNIYDGNGFSSKDVVDNTIKPTAYRMPLFQYSTYLIMKVFNIKKKDVIKAIHILNFISSVGVIILSFFIAYVITGNFTISFLVCILTIININLIYNSMLALTDTFFSFVMAVFIFIVILGIKFEREYLFFLSGITLGFSILTRPIVKFYPFVFMFLILTLKGDGVKSKILKVTFFLSGVLIVITPWILRNYAKMGFIGLETNQGLNTIWSTYPLVEIREKDKRDPIIYRIKQIIFENKDTSPCVMEAKVRKELNLSEKDSSKYFQKIGVETIISHPFEFLVIFLKNLMNNITSAVSELKIIDMLFKEGYYNSVGQAMIEMKNISKFRDINLKDVLTVMPNFIFRIVHFLTFIISVIGACLFIKKYKHYGFFLLSFVFYHIILTSAVAGYDRYRVPIEVVLNFFIAYFLYEIFKKKALKNFFINKIFKT